MRMHTWHVTQVLATLSLGSGISCTCQCCQSLPGSQIQTEVMSEVLSSSHVILL